MFVISSISWFQMSYVRFIGHIPLFLDRSKLQNIDKFYSQEHICFSLARVEKDKDDEAEIQIQRTKLN